MIALFRTVWPSVKNWNRFPERSLVSKKAIITGRREIVDAPFKIYFFPL